MNTNNLEILYKICALLSQTTEELRNVPLSEDMTSMASQCTFQAISDLKMELVLRTKHTTSIFEDEL